ncbi:hypothetical protein [Kineococcus sp. SYSU DK001]|uniref:hypothetical protein n=1 Tax=Kineococcus sp. SYSU DK001 TaxID=3383122 RepID=UPI003D7CE583
MTTQDDQRPDTPKSLAAAAQFADEDAPVGRLRSIDEDRIAEHRARLEAREQD